MARRGRPTSRRWSASFFFNILAIGAVVRCVWEFRGGSLSDPFAFLRQKVFGRHEAKLVEGGNGSAAAAFIAAAATETVATLHPVPQVPVAGPITAGAASGPDSPVAVAPIPQAAPPPPATVAPTIKAQLDEAAGGSPQEQQLVRVAHLRAGIYKDRAAHPEFAKVVLVTATNYAYLPFYLNWECHAKRFGLDWAVIANDDESCERLGEDRCMPAPGKKITGMVGWGNIKLDFVGTNKMMIIVLLMKLTTLDVVFTDCDNMFLQDPFAAGISLGDLIREKKYDYIYQPEGCCPPKPNSKPSPNGGNTGFFFVAGTRKPAKLRLLFQATVDEVMVHLAEGRGAADQNVFWALFNELIKTKGIRGARAFGFTCVRFCGRKPSCQAPEEETLDYCAMDPFMHPTGWEPPGDWMNKAITYHANWVANEGKIVKLKKMGLWDAWDPKQKVCVTKGEPSSETSVSEQPGAKGPEASPEQVEYEQRFARVVKLRAGVYKDRSAHPEFANVVLVTSANFAYFPFYQNWQCHASRFGLDWAVVANDDESCKYFGEDRCLPAPGQKITGMVGWGNLKLDEVGKNKMMTIVLLMKLTTLDVVFTDCDNMFIRDPFAAGVSLGDLIREKKYDYIYQPEGGKPPKPNSKPNGDGGNTGFFYVAGSRKPAKLQMLFQTVVDEVTAHLQAKRGGADQPIFWQLFNELAKTKGKAAARPFGFKCVRICNGKPSCEAPDGETIDYCPMDPFTHPTGWEPPGDWTSKAATYHANWAANEGKIGKLKKMGLWDIWDAKQEICRTPAEHNEVQDEAASQEQAESEARFAKVAKLRAGIYKDKAAHPELAKVVLVTAGNYAYMQFYKNWECHANRLGLDWAVVGNDDELCEYLGEDRCLPAPGKKITGMVAWGNAKLDEVGKNKMMTIVRMMKVVDLDVVFTDCDNMFLRDPFAAGVSLGDLIREKKYDYIYQPEGGKPPKKDSKPSGNGGNTGFFFVAGTRKPAKLAMLFQTVVDEVAAHLKVGRGGADQPIFWQLFNELINTKGKGRPFGFKCVRICEGGQLGGHPSCTASEEETIDYCPMDPFTHPTGWDPPGKWMKTAVTYHANWAVNEGKIVKLKAMGLWGVWDQKSKVCKEVEFDTT